MITKISLRCMNAREISHLNPTPIIQKSTCKYVHYMYVHMYVCVNAIGDFDSNNLKRALYMYVLHLLYLELTPGERVIGGKTNLT